MNRSYKIFLFFVVPLVYLMGFASTPFSQVPQVWTNLGLYGGQIYDIAIDPSNPDKMFAGSYLGGGLFVTTDGGSNWQAVVAAEQQEGEDTFKNHAVWAVKIAPRDNNVIWVAHNYWVEKSIDGGNTWTHIWNGWMQSSNYGTCSNCPAYDQYRWCLSLAVDPSDPAGDTVFVGTSGRYTNWTPYGAIYMTEDGGDTWRKLKGPVFDEPGPYTDPNDPGNFDYDVVDLSIDTSNPDVIVLWAVTRSSGIFIEKAGPEDKISDGTLYRGEINRSTGAETWTEVFSMEGGKFWDVEVKPDDPNSIFTANDWGIFRHYFEGGEWKYQWILNFSGAEPSPGAVFARNVSALAFDPQNPDILYAAWKNTISQWENIDTGSKVARGTPPYENANWEIYSTSGYQFEALTVHPENSEVIFGGEFYQGVYKSQDHSQSWTPVNNGINAIIVRDVEVDPNDANHLLAGTFIGVYEKRAAGDWILTSDFENTEVRSVAFDPTDTDGSTYYAGIEKRLAKTTNSGADWTFSDYLPHGIVKDIAVGSSGNTVFIATLGTGTTGVYKSENGLATPTLTQVLSSDQFGFNVVVIDPNDPEHIFAGGGNYFGTKVLGNLYESKTGGNAGTWQLTGLTDVIVNALLIDPRDSNIMYAGCGWSGGTDVPVYRSSDHGATWTPSFEGIPGHLLPARAIWGTSPTDVFVVGEVYAVTNSALIFHYDGSAWTHMDSGIPQSLRGVWGTSSTDVFAVGTNGTILHYNGSTWSAMSSGTSERIIDVWGSAQDNVYAVGDNGTILHYDGSTWSAMGSSSTEHLWGVWGTSSTHVFAVGTNGTILHYNGSTWSAMSSGTSEELREVWGASGADVFAVGNNGTILHYNGSTWSAMNSGTSKLLTGVWGASGTNVFVVGYDDTVIHYNGSGWTNMDSGITESTSDIEGVWGSSGTDVFAANEVGAIVHYDGESWAIMRPGGANWNSVTDLEFHRQNKSVVYASTSQQGVYLSPNEAADWLNLGKPEFMVLAISTSSLYAATEGGLLQCTGTGVIAGRVNDILATPLGVDGATITTDLGVKTIGIYGLYMMVHPAGIFRVTASADGYLDESAANLTVLGGDVTWGDMSMPPDLKIVDVLPHHRAGMDDSTRVPNNTSFAALIHDYDGIDITDPANVKFTIDDGVNAEYTRDLTHPTFRGIKMDPAEGDTQVTRLWVVYDRSNDNVYGNAYQFNRVVTIKIDAADVTGNQITPQAEYSFRTETAAEHADAQDKVPGTKPVDPGDPALGGLYDAGYEVTSGALKGAKVLYNSAEPVKPQFGPLEELPVLHMEEGQGVGLPINLQPHTVFENPVRVYIPCPAWQEVSELAVGGFKGGKWEVICDADGNVMSAGVGMMKPFSREDHPDGNPSLIEVELYHFSGVQAIANAAPPAPVPPGPVTVTSGGSGGGGCFVATAAYGSPMAKQVDILRKFRDAYLVPNWVGQKLVAFYYETGRPIAAYLESHPWLKRPVRCILYPVVGLAWLLLSTNAIAKIFIVLCVLGVCLAAFKRGRARVRTMEAR